MKIYYKSVAPILFLILMGLLLLCPQLANAQSNPRNPCYYPTPTSTNCIPTSSTSPLPVTASVSVGGFTPALTFATLTATGSSASTALPAGTTVFFQNTGTTVVSCTLGVGSAIATANEIIVPASSGVPVVVGSNTFGACIDQTGSASNLIVLAGGSGLGNAFGGGSSGGGSSGAVFGPTAGGVAAANPPVQIGGVQTNSNTGLVQPWVINSTGNGLIDAPAGSNLATLVAAPVPCLTATTSTTNSYTPPAASPANCDPNGNLYTNSKITGNVAITAASLPLPTGAATSANQGSDPCVTGTKTSIPISITTNTTTNILVGTAAQKTYVCQLMLTSAAADNVAVIQGTTGGTCGSGTLGLIGGVTAANGLNFAANGGVSIGNGGAQVLQTTVNNNDICLITSVATPLAGTMTYVKQ